MRLASASALALAVAAGPALAGPEAGNGSSGTGSPGNSAAEIRLEDCLLESSKDIAYIAYIDDGDEVKKENINQPTFDLSTVDGIDEIDTIRVKSGQTVETFDNACTST